MQLRIIGIAHLSLIATGGHQLIAEKIAAGVLNGSQLSDR
jgi:hypothetical protein